MPGWKAPRSNGPPPRRDGVWAYGTDYTEGTDATRVIAVHVGGDGDPSNPAWIGPALRAPSSLEVLGRWAEGMIVNLGGYVHLLPADGRAGERKES
jgi:hypothetical protein